jgi:hypothetical protein
MAKTTGTALLGVGNIQGPSHAFLNILMQTAVTTTQSTTWPSLLKANQLPKDGALAADVTWTCPFPSSAALGSGYTGKYRLKWTGTGGIRIQLSNVQLTIHSVTGGTSFQNSTYTYFSGANCVAVFSMVAPVTSNFIGAWPTTTNGTTALTYASFDNISLVRYENATPDDATRLDGGELMNPDFVAAYRALNVFAVRTMDWCGTNIVTNTQGDPYVPLMQWSYRPPMNTPGIVNGYYPGSEWWAGNVTGTNTYTSPKAPSIPTTWTHGMTWTGYFSATNSVNNPTIAITGVSGGAPKPLVRVAANTGDTPINTLDIGSIRTDRPTTFFYDGVLDIVVTGPAGIVPFVPIEYSIALANAIECNLWSCFPYMADDDFITQTTAIVKNTLVHHWYPEFSNELWNTLFNSRWWVKRMGIKLGFPVAEAGLDYASLRLRQMMGTIIPAAWSPRSISELNRVMPGQATASTVGTQQLYQWEGAHLVGATYPLYLAHVGGVDPGYNVAGNRAIDFCQILSYAIYFSGALMNANGLFYVSGGSPVFSPSEITTFKGWIDTYVAGDQQSAFQSLDADARYGSRAGALSNGTLYGFAKLSNGTGVYPAWETAASKVGYPSDLKILPYETGYEGQAPTEANCTTMGLLPAADYAANSAAMLTAYKNSKFFTLLVQDVMRQYLGVAENNPPYYTAKGQLPKHQGGCWFAFQGPNGAWPMLTGSIYKPGFKSYDAFKLFNTGKRQWSIRT